MDDELLKQDLLAEWKTEKADPPLLLDLVVSREERWSLGYDHLVGGVLCLTGFSLFFNRHRATITGRCLEAAFKAVMNRERATLNASLPDPGDNREFISLITMAATDDKADVP